MSINPHPQMVDKKLLWYLATVCGFAIGFVIGGDFLRPSHPWAGPWLETIFWAFPAGGAGLGMGMAQWILIRRVHKNAFLWIPATTIGVIAITGGALLLTIVTGAFFRESLSSFFRNFADWFVPWLKLLTIISPVAILLGAILQWLMLRHFTENQSFKEFLRMSVGWISAFILLLIVIGFVGNLVQTRNDILNLLVGMMTTIPTGLIFAFITQDIIKHPQRESRSL